jgi:hypothetical protein
LCQVVGRATARIGGVLGFIAAVAIPILAYLGWSPHRRCELEGAWSCIKVCTGPGFITRIEAVGFIDKVAEFLNGGRYTISNDHAKTTMSPKWFDARRWNIKPDDGFTGKAVENPFLTLNDECNRIMFWNTSLWKRD